MKVLNLTETMTITLKYCGTKQDYLYSFKALILVWWTLFFAFIAIITLIFNDLGFPFSILIIVQLIIILLSILRTGSPEYFTKWHTRIIWIIQILFIFTFIYLFYSL